MPDKWMLVRGARQILTLRRPSGGPADASTRSEPVRLGGIPDGSVLIRNGVIEAVGPTRRIENLADASDAEEIDAAGRVVMPAFVDARASLVVAPASYHAEQIEPAPELIERSVQAHPASRLEARADSLLRLMARHGTGSVGAYSSYGSDATGHLKILKALACCDGKPLSVIPILSMSRPPAGDDGYPELLDCIARRKLAGIVSVPAAALAMPARDRGFSVCLDVLSGHDPGVIQAAVEMPALSITLSAPLRITEIELLSNSSTTVVLQPARLHKCTFGSARRLLDNGVRIALGSGLNPETAATASMQMAIQLACRELEMQLGEAITAATIGAAWALGVGPYAGSLEYGKQADLILLNASDYRDLPLLAGTNLVHLMMKRGVVLFKEDFTGWPERN